MPRCRNNCKEFIEIFKAKRDFNINQKCRSKKFQVLILRAFDYPLIIFFFKWTINV